MILAFRNTPDAYGRVAVAFHWSIAGLIILNLAIGIFVATLPDNDPGRYQWIPTHKSIGLTVLMLSLLRLGWRLVNPVPGLPADQPPILAFAARCSAWFFYLFMIAVPMTGWAESSLAGYQPSFFGLFPWPLIGPLTALPAAQKKDLLALFMAGHAYLAFAMLALLLLHISAALYHQFARRDDVLARMLLRTRS